MRVRLRASRCAPDAGTRDARSLASGLLANGMRNGYGKLSTHCRTGRGPNTSSTRCRADSAMRRAPQLGQKRSHLRQFPHVGWRGALSHRGLPDGRHRQRADVGRTPQLPVNLQCHARGRLRTSDRVASDHQKSKKVSGTISSIEAGMTRLSRFCRAEMEKVVRDKLR